MKILCFSDQKPEAIRLSLESIERLKEAYVQKHGHCHGEYQWVAVPDVNGSIHVLKWK